MLNSSSLPEYVGNEISDGKNANKMTCKFCPSVILMPKSASFVRFEFDLPKIHQKSGHENHEVETEKIDSFWEVSDIYTFENVGVSKTIGNTKYLACADCELGPIGYHNTESKKSFIAFPRVNYV